MRLGLVAGAAVLVLSGCGGQDPSSGADFDHVMKDPEATAAEIIAAAGPPDEIAKNADGSMMVLWRPFIVPEDEHGPFEGATAWRMYDAEGQSVATYSSPDLEHLSLTATQDGFLLYEPDISNGFVQVYLVDNAGVRHKVGVDDDRLATRAGDAFVQSGEVMRFYRPTDRTLHELLPEPYAPRGVVQWYGALLDEQGALWIRVRNGDDQRVGWSRDGGRTMQRQQLPLEHPRAHIDDSTMVLGPAGTAAVLTDQTAPGDSVRPSYLDLVSDYGGKIQRVTARTLPFLDRLFMRLDLSVMTDGRVLLGDYEAGEWWVAEDGTNLEFVRLNVPTNTAFVRDLAGTLYAWGEWDHREATLQTSTDDGATWQTFDVSP